MATYDVVSNVWQALPRNRAQRPRCHTPLSRAGADIARHVIVPRLEPRFLGELASYAVASNVRAARVNFWCLRIHGGASLSLPLWRRGEQYLPAEALSFPTNGARDGSTPARRDLWTLLTTSFTRRQFEPLCMRWIAIV